MAEQKRPFLFRQGSEVNNFDRMCTLCIPYKNKENKEAKKGSGARLIDIINFVKRFQNFIGGILT